MHLHTIDHLLCHTKLFNQHNQTVIDDLMITALKPPTFFSDLTDRTFVSFIISGMQEVMLGEQKFLMQAGDMYFMPFKLPVSLTYRIIDKRPQFLALTLALNEQVIVETVQKHQLKTQSSLVTGVAVAKINSQIENCLTRLIDLLDEPSNYLALADLYKKELIIHLLNTPLKTHLILFANQNSHLQKIKKVCHYIQTNLAEKFSVAQLARMVNMGESSFYQHFKIITGLTPIQYQKSMRLNQAQKLLAENQFSVTQTAYQIGYESLSQFSREYKRQFGVSPRENVE
ncbi:AraC family transcriptional regulator [Actinobacillus capsulatus]|uniref:AraC family transcriptional regulator n=1 Tax=Actinobacillus capsulatus TaxID=717 RepID=UPI00036D252F|nr:AraC family transcriptional regulator [Actinobacillus capsulatus]